MMTEEVTERPQAGFDGKARLKSLRDGNWQMLDNLGYRIGEAWLRQQVAAFQRLHAHDMRWFGYSALNEKMTVFQGFVHDFASVPRIFWTFISPTCIRRPAIHHDAWYETLKELWWANKITDKSFAHYRRVADLIFKESMEHAEPRIAAWKRCAAYRAVRMFGWYDRAMRRERRRRLRESGERRVVRMSRRRRSINR